MDTDAAMPKVGEFGKYQKVFLVVLPLSSIFNGMTRFVLNFSFGEQTHR